MSNTSQFLTVSEVAAILGISRQGVWKRIKAGKLQALRVGPVFAIPAEAIGR